MTLPIKDRLLNKLVPGPNGCWIFTGGKVHGYGCIGVDGGSSVQRAHRVSWEVHIGPIPEGKLVCHRCDNPACCNPDHLFLGTALDNLKDMIAKGRDNLRSGRKGKLAAANVHDIRRRLKAGERPTSIGRVHKVSHAAIWCIKTGASWSWLPEEVTPAPPPPLHWSTPTIIPMPLRSL